MAEPVAEREQQRTTSHSHLPLYLGVWVALLFFTVLTYTLARIHLPGAWAVTVALLIAACKGALVVLFFMHLWDQSGANRLVFLTSLVFVALLIGLIITTCPPSTPPARSNPGRRSRAAACRSPGRSRTASPCSDSCPHRSP
jgi:cytochrome c oxidase subunit 4